MKKSIHIFLPFSFVVEKLDLKEEFLPLNFLMTLECKGLKLAGKIIGLEETN
jgi:hypothetical protein